MAVTKEHVAEATDLLSKMKELAPVPERICTLTLTNQCPPQWNVVIVGGGCKFFNRDGTDYTDGPRPLNVTSGQSTAFVSRDQEKCVFQYFLAINVRAGDEQRTLTKQDAVGPGECMLSVPLVLGPTKTISERSLRDRRLEDMIEVSVSPC